MPGRGAMFLLAGLLPALFVFSPVDARTKATASATACALPTQVSGNVTLDKSCTYQGTITISISNVSLDCAGAAINATSVGYGILIKGKALRNVHVKNCTVTGAKRQGILIAQPMTDAEMAALPKEERYNAAPQGVVIENTTVLNSAGVGIYVDSYAQDTKLIKVKVTRNGRTGVYLEHSSVRTTIDQSVFTKNGFGDVYNRRKGGAREGLAIDSSAHNTITNSLFDSNAAGGIFLYKNCWEKHSKPGTVARWQHSSYNTIAGNKFQNERVGVWVASRQTKNLSKWDCGDPALAPGYYRDYAEHNTLKGNTFTDGLIGVRIEDDFTVLEGNHFDEPAKACVELGSLLRDQLLGTPIKGTTLADNSCSLDSASNAYRAIGESEYAVCKGNALDGKNYQCQ